MSPSSSKSLLFSLEFFQNFFVHRKENEAIDFLFISFFTLEIACLIHHSTLYLFFLFLSLYFFLSKYIVFHSVTGHLFNKSFDGYLLNQYSIMKILVISNLKKTLAFFSSFLTNTTYEFFHFILCDNWKIFIFHRFLLYSIIFPICCILWEFVLLFMYITLL